MLTQGIDEEYTNSTMYYSVYVGDFVSSNMYRKRVTMASYDSLLAQTMTRAWSAEEKILTNGGYCFNGMNNTSSAYFLESVYDTEY